MADTERLLSREEVAARLGLSVLTVGDMLRAGRLPGFHLGRLWRVREEDLNAYVRELAKEGERERAARAAKREGARKRAAVTKAAKAAREAEAAGEAPNAAAKANATRGPAGRSAAARKANKTRGPEGRSEAARKANATRKANAAGTADEGGEP